MTKIQLFTNPKFETEYRPVKDVFGFSLNDMEGNPVQVQCGKGEIDHVPVVNPLWEHDKKVVNAIFDGIRLNKPVLLRGDSGAGKSEGIEQFFAAINAPLLVVQCTEEMETMDLMGTDTLGHDDEKGGVVTQERHGVIPFAFENDIPVVFNEVDYVRPGVWGEAQTFLRSEEVHVKAFNKVVRRSPNVRFFGTMNSFGLGDNGDWAGAQNQNIASLNRWLRENVPYPKRSVETAILKKAAPQFPASHIETLLTFARLIRNARDAGELPLAYGVRTLVDTAQVAVLNQSIERGIAMSYLNGLETLEQVETVKKLYKKAFGREWSYSTHFDAVEED